MSLAYIGLGSNLDNPILQVTQALNELSQLSACHLVAQSSLYRSRAVGPIQPDYINAVALLETSLSPLALLDALQQLEQTHQRVRLEHWGPRTLDLDLLLFDQQIIEHTRLVVPHPFLTQRNFVLYPLAEITPNLTLPGGAQLKELIAQYSHDGLERLQNY